MDRSILYYIDEFLVFDVRSESLVWLDSDNKEPLTRTENKVLSYFLKHPETNLNTTRMTVDIWENGASAQQLHNIVLSLRKKGLRDYIKTVYHFGYRLERTQTARNMQEDYMLFALRPKERSMISKLVRTRLEDLGKNIYVLQNTLDLEEDVKSVRVKACMDEYYELDKLLKVIRSDHTIGSSGPKKDTSRKKPSYSSSKTSRDGSSLVQEGGHTYHAKGAKKGMVSKRKLPLPSVRKERVYPEKEVMARYKKALDELSR